MKKIFYLLICALLLLSISLPNMSFTQKAHAQNSTVTVIADVVNLREGPGLTYDILKKLDKGTELTFLERHGDWYYVQTGKIKGWVAFWLVKKNNAPSSITTDNKISIVVAQIDHLNIRQEPNLSSPVLAQLFTGNEANYIKDEGNWVQIQFGKITGWVSKEYITIGSNQQQSTSTTNNSSSTKAAKLEYFNINVDAVNVRKKADLNSKKLGVVYRNSSYKILDEKNGWIQIEFSKNEMGWVNSLYGTRSASKTSSPSTQSETKASNKVTIIYNGTNLREQPTTQANVVKRVDAGNRFEVIEETNDWYKIKISSSQTAYVANWVVTTDQTATISKSENNSKPKVNRKKDTLNGLTIVVDAGHGGNDHGTTGKRGTDEKDITLLTAERLKSKLQSAGANVVMTRDSDVYVSLKNRASLSNQIGADAFISLHYDATEDSSISGITTYYTKSAQKELGEYVHAGLKRKVDLRDRGVQPGNYYVLRENYQPAILIELGFLSNASEERKVITDYYREQATLGIYQGIINYFNAQLAK